MGRLARRDLLVNQADTVDRWYVIARDSGSDSPERSRTFYCAQDAITLAEHLMEDPDPIDDWREPPVG